MFLSVHLTLLTCLSEEMGDRCAGCDWNLVEWGGCLRIKRKIQFKIFMDSIGKRFHYSCLTLQTYIPSSKGKARGVCRPPWLALRSMFSYGSLTCTVPADFYIAPPIPDTFNIFLGSKMLHVMGKVEKQRKKCAIGLFFTLKLH